MSLYDENSAADAAMVIPDYATDKPARPPAAAGSNQGPTSNAKIAGALVLAVIAYYGYTQYTAPTTTYSSQPQAYAPPPQGSSAPALKLCPPPPPPQYCPPPSPPTFCPPPPAAAAAGGAAASTMIPPVFIPFSQYQKNVCYQLRAKNIQVVMHEDMSTTLTPHADNCHDGNPICKYTQAIAHKSSNGSSVISQISCDLPHF